MTHYLYILLGLSSFWIGTILPHFFDSAFSPVFCLLICCRTHISKIFLYFLIVLYLLEQFILHSTFKFPILIIIPILFSSIYVEKVTRISLFALQIFTLWAYLVVEYYALGLMYGHFVSWSTFLYKFCASLCTIFIFSCFIERSAK